MGNSHPVPLDAVSWERWVPVEILLNMCLKHDFSPFRLSKNKPKCIKYIWKEVGILTAVTILKIIPSTSSADERVLVVAVFFPFEIVVLGLNS